MASLAEIEAQLRAPGAPFATTEEDVLGERMTVFGERPRSLRELVERSRAFGEADYVVYEDRRLSFDAHARRVASLAAALRDEYGVAPGDRVALFAANRPEWVLGYWATVSLGAIAVALNGWWTEDEARYGIEHSEPRLLIGDRKRLARLSGSPLACPVLEMESDRFEALCTAQPDAALPDTPIDEDAPANILYTSGTTGRPKGAVITHRSVICFVQTGTFHGMRLVIWNAQRHADDAPPPLPPAMLVNAPLFHLSGLYAGAVTCLANGLKSVYMEGRFDPERVMRVIEAEQITNWGPMGTMIHRVADHPSFGKYDLSSLRNVGSGGAPVGRELQAKMLRSFPTSRLSLGIGYGLTESVASLTIIGGDELAEHPDTVGRPLPTVEIQIRDADGKPVPEGVHGEIFARGPMLMKEYWRNPGATAEAIRPGRWLRTGDFGKLEDGYLSINSRMRDLILRGGENVYPAEIEQCLEDHPGVQEVAVVGVDHPELGQEVKAIVVPASGARPREEELADWCRERLAYFKVPTHWEWRPEPLPRNATGKVLKSLLLEGGPNPFMEE